VLVRLHAGPQFDAEAFASLAGRAFRIADLDRTGARLDGPAVPHPAPSIPSDGSPLGAVQIPPDGRPIVLLADRGRTGGYAKPAVVDPRDLWRFAQARPGDEVAFVDARGAAERLGAPEPLDSWA
jgi:allophanate hydrolase subunit 2